MKQSWDYKVVEGVRGFEVHEVMEGYSPQRWLCMEVFDTEGKAKEFVMLLTHWNMSYNDALRQVGKLPGVKSGFGLKDGKKVPASEFDPSER